MMGYGMKFLQEQYKISAALAGMGGGVAALGKDTNFLLNLKALRYKGLAVIG